MKHAITILSFLYCVTLGAQLPYCNDITGSGSENLGTSIDQVEYGRSLVVGAPGAANGSGVVTIYRWPMSCNWTPYGTITGTPNSNFGSSVGINYDGDRIVVGAPASNFSNGTVTVYEYTNFVGYWYQVGSDISAGTTPDDFGKTVGIGGNRIVVGAPGYMVNGVQVGLVQVYELVQNTWIQYGQNLTGSAGSIYGKAVEISGNRIVVGIDDAVGTVKVFELTNNLLLQVGNDLTNSGNGKESVSISGYSSNRVAITAPGLNSRIYEDVNGVWALVGSSLPFGGESIELSFDGQSVVIGRPSTGIVRQYVESGGAWTQLGMNVTGDSLGDGFGSSVTMMHYGGIFTVAAPANGGYVRQFDTSVLSSTEEESNIGALTVFPNPSDGLTQIRLEGIRDEITHVCVTDLLGKVVWETVPGHVGSDWTQELILADSGVYLVSIKIGEELLTEKFVVAK